MSRADVIRAVVHMDERVEKLSWAVSLMAQYVALHTDAEGEANPERQSLFNQIMNDGECQEQVRKALTYQRADERREYVEKLENALARVAYAAAHPNVPSPAHKEDWNLAEQLILRNMDLISGPLPTTPQPPSLKLTT